MDLKKLRQILRALADDTRLRIVYLLNGRELTVTELCSSLEVSQPAVSKHLVRLRLLKIVNDRREGNFIYYSLTQDKDIRKITKLLFSEFDGLPTFTSDRKRLVAVQK